MPPGSNGATPGPSAPGDHIDDDDRQDRADSGDHDRADVQRTVDRLGVEEDAGEEAANEGANDPENDVADDPEALVALGEEAREVAGDRAEDQPGDDAHRVPPIPCRTCTCVPVLFPGTPGNIGTVRYGPTTNHYAGGDRRFNRLAGPGRETLLSDGICSRSIASRA